MKEEKPRLTNVREEKNPFIFVKQEMNNNKTGSLTYFLDMLR